MRASLIALLLTACGQLPTASEQKAAAGGECLLQKSDLSALFGDVSGAGELVSAAARAGEVAAAAAAQKETFDAKILEIAADPEASAAWEKVAADPSRARSAGLAADLPGAASRARKAGVDAAEVKTAIEGASKARMAPTELADAFGAVTKAVEVYGPIPGFGLWFSSQVQAGERGVALVDAIEVEHQSKGAKSGAEKVEICHSPPGNPDKAHTVSVASSALSAHLAHGDTEGACPEGGAGLGKQRGKSGSAGGRPEGTARGAGRGAAEGKGGKAGKAEGKSGKAEGKGGGRGRE